MTANEQLRLTPTPQLPDLFRNNNKLRNKFLLLATELFQNQAVFQSDSNRLSTLQEAVERIARHLHRDLLRGSDFMDRNLTPEAMSLLVSHPHLMALGVQACTSKLGRLGAVIVMHPRCEELISIVTAKLVTNNYFITVQPHVSRLLTHQNARECEEFAIETLKHSEIFNQVPASSDGFDSFIFWTYGPYVLAGLKENGKSYLDLVNSWLARRTPSQQYERHARYPGIECLYESPSAQMHYLTKNGSDPSHLFVKFITDIAIIPQII